MPGRFTALVSAGQVNGNGAFNASLAGSSADGARVFFVTFERLVSNDNDSSQDIYERSAGTTKRVSVGQINGNGAVNASMGGTSSDGTHVFFATGEPLVPADTDAGQDVYERYGGSTKLVSSGQVNGNRGNAALFAGASADGTRVFFHTEEVLVPSDTDRFQDIYEHSGGTTTRVSVGSATFPEWSPVFRGESLDGSAVFYSTGVQVLADDSDASIDLYAAYLAP